MIPYALLTPFLFDIICVATGASCNWAYLQSVGTNVAEGYCNQYNFGSDMVQVHLIGHVILALIPQPPRIQFTAAWIAVAHQLNQV